MHPGTGGGASVGGGGMDGCDVVEARSESIQSIEEDMVGCCDCIFVDGCCGSATDTVEYGSNAVGCWREVNCVVIDAGCFTGVVVLGCLVVVVALCALKAENGARQRLLPVLVESCCVLSVWNEEESLHDCGMKDSEQPRTTSGTGKLRNK